MKIFKIKKSEPAEIKISFNGLMSGLEATEKRISKCAGRSIEIIQNEIQRE